MLSGLAGAQTVGTEGTDFWFSYLNNWLQRSGNPIQLELYITATDTASGTVEIPLAANFTPIGFEVVPGVATRLTLPTSLAMAEGSETVENKGIHIVTDQKVSVYAMNKRQYSADVTVLLPTATLGREYRVVSHWESGNRNNGDNSQSEFMVVAITDNTEIEITPTAATVGGSPVGVPFTVFLNQGQVFQVQADGDLTGTLVRSKGNSSCDNFAVFGGNRYTKVGQCDHPDGHDHLYTQLYPTNTWGKDFTIMPFRSRFGGDVVKVLAKEDSTKVVFGNSPADTVVIDRAGEFLQRLIDDVQYIRTDKPVSIGQFSRSQACDNSTSDPFLITISPNEQLLKRVTFNAPTIATVDNYYLNVAVPSDNVQSIRLNGVSIGGSFSPVPGDNDMYFARLSIGRGNNTLESAAGFIAYVYGYGNNESFGYATGASLENLEAEILVQDANTIGLPADSLCRGVEVFFEARADTTFNSYLWEFGDGSFLEVDSNAPVAHSYDRDGEYQVQLTLKEDDGDCASGTQVVSRKNVIIRSPDAELLGPGSVCPNTTDVAYFANSDWNNTYEWQVSGGIFDTFLPGDSVLVDWGDTNDQARISIVPTSNLGCIGDTVIRPVRINLQLQPEQPFGPDTLCSSDISEIIYTTFKVNSSLYTWQVENGSILSGQGENEISVDWDTWGYGKLWFREESTLDDVCAGDSDTLTVFIERYPSEEVIVQAPDTLQILEPFMISVQSDTIFQLLNYDLGDGTEQDTVSIDLDLSHAYDCYGDYLLSFTVFDTLGVCKANSLAQKSIHVLQPYIEVINVTNSEADSSLVINWNSSDLANYPGEMLVNRQMTFPTTEFEVLSISGETSMIDQNVSSLTSIYEYTPFIRPSSDCVIESIPHNNLLLRIQSENNQSGRLSWNDYGGWQNGVETYQIWRAVDDGEWSLKQEVSDPDIEVLNTNEGFEFCYRINAIERSGNESYSLSNTACIEFYPEVVTYNVISPNGDGKNDFFVIENIEHYPNSEFDLSNRYGKSILTTIGYQNNFSGILNGRELPAGVYFWSLNLNEPRAPQQLIKGYLQIMR